MSNTLLQYTAEGYREVAPERMFGRASVRGTGEVEWSEGYRAVSPEEMFGSDSELVVGTAAEPAALSLVADPVFQSFVVLTLVVYIYMLLRSWNFMGSIWSGIFSSSSERTMAAMGGELPLERFKQVASVIGGVAVALIAVRLADGFVSHASFVYTGGVESLATPAALVGVVVYVAWFYALHKILEWVARSDSPSQLSAIGYMDFVRTVVLLHPFVVVWLLADEQTLFGATLVLSVGLALLIILYLKDTFLFFVGKKIPILYWILYLCTAILLPLSFLARLLPEKLG